MVETGRWIWDEAQMRMVPAHEYRRTKYASGARSDLPMPMLIRDELDYVENPADGARYTSKRAYERAVRDAGCEIIGNEPLNPAPKPELPSPGEELSRVWDELESR